MSLQVATTPPKTVLVCTNFRLIQNTDVFGRLKRSWQERSGRDRQNTNSTHFEQTCFERGLHSQFGMAYKAMLLSDVIPTIFPLSKKAVKAPTKKTGAFFKARKTQRKWPFSNTPMHNPVHFRAKQHVHTMLTVSVFTAWKHAVIFHINKTSYLILYPGKTNIKTLNLSHYACACFEFFKWSELWLNSFCYFIK